MAGLKFEFVEVSLVHLVEMSTSGGLLDPSAGW